MNTLSTKSPSRRSHLQKQIETSGKATNKATTVECGSEGSWTTDEGSAADGEGETLGVDDRIRKLVWKDGSFYAGEIDEAGVPHGHGRLVRACDGCIFDGEWRHGEVTGQGIFQGSHDVGTFSGQWRADELVSGYARVVFPDGAAYEGDWTRQRPEGFGQFINPNGVLFRGEWRAGVFQPQLSGYDPRGIVTNNRQYNFTATSENAESSEALNRVSTTAADANLSESRLQYNGVPGDQTAQIELPAPALALRKGTFEPNSGCFLYDTQEFESQVYPDDPSRSGCRLDAGYMYRTRYNTEVWNETLEAEEPSTAMVEQQQQSCSQHVSEKKQQHEQGQQCLKEEPEEQQQLQRVSHRTRKRVAASNKEGYEDPNEREFGNDEEFPVEIENDTDQPLKPNTNTCLTCPEPLSAYRVSPAGLSSGVAPPPQFRTQTTGPAQWANYSAPPQHVSPIAYYQPPQYMPYTPNLLTSSTTGRYEVYPDGLPRASPIMPRRVEDVNRRERGSTRGGNAQVISAARKNKRDPHEGASNNSKRTP